MKKESVSIDVVVFGRDNSNVKNKLTAFKENVDNGSIIDRGRGCQRVRGFLVLARGHYREPQKARLRSLLPLLSV